MKNDGFRFLTEAFQRFANDHSGANISGRIVRSLGAGAQAAADRALQEFPDDFVNEFVGDFYTLLSSQEVADGISATFQAFDEEKVKDALDSLVFRMQQDDVALKLAEGLKGALDKTSVDDLENLLDAAMMKRSMSERMVAKAFFSQIKPQLESMRGMSAEDVAGQIKDMAAQIPTDMIALQLGALTREVTPERVSMQMHGFVGGLPSPQAVSDIVRGVGELASDKFGQVANANGLSDARDALSGFRDEAAGLVQRTIANDIKSKKTFKPKGGDFDL